MGRTEETKEACVILRVDNGFLYLLCFLLKNGYAPVEFFLEGTRSRSAKTLTPKFGRSQAYYPPGLQCVSQGASRQNMILFTSLTRYCFLKCSCSGHFGCGGFFFFFFLTRSGEDGRQWVRTQTAEGPAALTEGLPWSSL